MIRPFMIVFAEPFGTRDFVQNVLDQIPEIPFWYSCFPHAVFFTSSLSAFEIVQRIESLVPKAVYNRWIVVAIETRDAHGRLPEAAWHLINHPEDPRLVGAPAVPPPKPKAKLTPPRKN